MYAIPSIYTKFCGKPVAISDSISLDQSNNFVTLETVTSAVKVFDRDLPTTEGSNGGCRFKERKTSLYRQCENTWGTPHPVDTRLVRATSLYLPFIHLLPPNPAAHQVNLSTTRIVARQRSWFRGSLHERHVVCDLSRKSETAGREKAGEREGERGHGV